MQCQDDALTDALEHRSKREQRPVSARTKEQPHGSGDNTNKSNYSEPIRKIAAAQLSFCSCGVLAK